MNSVINIINHNIKWPKIFKLPDERLPRIVLCTDTLRATHLLPYYSIFD